MSQLVRPVEQSLVEQLLLEVSTGVSLDDAARILGISSAAALDIMQQHDMEVRVLNLVSIWTDAQFKLLAGEAPAPAASNQPEIPNNVVDFSAHFRVR